MIRFRVEKSDRQFINPKQVKRASRLAVNQITSEIHKELGGEIPREHGTSIVGYRRVRSKKKLAKARGKGLRGVVWQGTLRIQAKYAGKPRKVKGGVKAGKHFFPNAFIMTFKSGYSGIFKRKDGKFVEEHIKIDKAKRMVDHKAREKLRELPAAFRKHYIKQIKR